MSLVQSLRIGTDIVSVERVGRLVERRGSSFLTRWFTEAEIAYCSGKAHPEQHFAARLAAKESVVKALRLPWDGPIPYRSVEITSDPTVAPGCGSAGGSRRQPHSRDLGRSRYRSPTARSTQ